MLFRSLASLVLATGFAFIHEHAGRSGNADAPFTLLVTEVVALAWLSQRHPWAVAWLGPTLGAIFLLKGPAVLLPLLCLVGFKVLCRHRVRWAAGPVCVAVVAFGLSVGGWAYARYALDGRQFFAAMLENDLWGVTATHLEGHVQGPLFYLNVLQRYHYEWLVPIAIAAVVCRRAWPIVGRHILASIRDREPVTVLMICWFVATFVLPSVMQTRITWYLNSFYPLGATLCGLLFEHAGRSVGRARLTEAFVLTVCLAVVVAESKSLWRLHRVTNLDTSVQGGLREHARRTGHIRVFRDKHYENEAFYVRAVLGGEFSVRDRERPRHRFRSGDLVVTASESPEAGLVLSAVADGHRIYVVP